LILAIYGADDDETYGEDSRIYNAPPKFKLRRAEVSPMGQSSKKETPYHDDIIV
jgi:hypothetical protein